MSNTALCLTALLLLIPIFISYKEGLHIIKDLVVASVCVAGTVNHLRFYIALYFQNRSSMDINVSSANHYYKRIVEHN